MIEVEAARPRAATVDARSGWRARAKGPPCRAVASLGGVDALGHSVRLDAAHRGEGGVARPVHLAEPLAVRLRPYRQGVGVYLDLHDLDAALLERGDLRLRLP